MEVCANSHNFRFRLPALHIQNLSNRCRHKYDQSNLTNFRISFLAGFLQYDPTVWCTTSPGSILLLWWWHQANRPRRRRAGYARAAMLGHTLLLGKDNMVHCALLLLACSCPLLSCAAFTHCALGSLKKSYIAWNSNNFVNTDEKV